MVELLCTIVGRLFGTLGILYFLSLCGHKRSLSFREVCFISYAGMIRGAIAFGLVLKLPKSLPNRVVIVTTSLTLVVTTTIVFGSLMPLV